MLVQDMTTVGYMPTREEYTALKRLAISLEIERDGLRARLAGVTADYAFSRSVLAEMERAYAVATDELLSSWGREFRRAAAARRVAEYVRGVRGGEAK